MKGVEADDLVHQKRGRSQPGKSRQGGRVTVDAGRPLDVQTRLPLPVMLEVPSCLELLMESVDNRTRPGIESVNRAQRGKRHRARAARVRALAGLQAENSPLLRLITLVQEHARKGKKLAPIRGTKRDSSVAGAYQVPQCQEEYALQDTHAPPPRPLSPPGSLLRRHHRHVRNRNPLVLARVHVGHSHADGVDLVRWDTPRTHKEVQSKCTTHTTVSSHHKGTAQSIHTVKCSRHVGTRIHCRKLLLRPPTAERTALTSRPRDDAAVAVEVDGEHKCVRTVG